MAQMAKIKLAKQKNDWKNCITLVYFFLLLLLRTSKCVLIFQYSFFVFSMLIVSKFAFAINGEPYTSAIVVDAESGKIYYEHNADKKIYPASLTKMMTAYLTFEAIEQGVIGVNDKISMKTDKIIALHDNFIGKNATIKDLLYKLAVISNNNAGNLLAQEVSGDRDKFVLKMNEKAKKFKMKNTNFASPHGLFDENNYSTARDMAKLAIRLVYDFPKYSDFFSTTNYIDENGDYNTKTTQIQQNVRGVDGGKTGFLNASGNNLVIWGRQGDRNVFVVLIGTDTKKQRDGIALKLLNYAINSDGGYTHNLIDKKTIKQKNKLYKDALFFVGIDADKYNTFQNVRERQPIIRQANTDYEDTNKENNLTQNRQPQQKVKYFYKSSFMK